MVIDRFIEKNSEGQLQGLILNWTCCHCEKLNIEPLVRREAAFGEKYSICPICEGEVYVKFSPSTMMSEREKIVQQTLSLFL